MEPFIAVGVIVTLLIGVAVRFRRGVVLPAHRPAAAASRIADAVRQRDGRRRARSAECDRIEDSSRESLTGRPVRGERVTGFEALALDVWCGKDFTLRNRAVGLGWIPFVDRPDHHETPEIARQRLERVYQTSHDEQKALSQMRTVDGGRIALAAAVVAARIFQFPVWHDDSAPTGPSVRLVLSDEVSHLTEAAIKVRDQSAVASPPEGDLALDVEVVETFIRKSDLLQARLDALMNRLRALDELVGVVSRMQKESDKASWLEEVRSIDELDSSADAFADSLHADYVREQARLSEFEARIRSTVDSGPIR